MGVQAEISRIMELLEAHSESPLRQLKGIEVQSDAEYLELWFRVAEVAYWNVDWAARIINHDMTLESFELRLKLKEAVRGHCEEILKSRSEALSFEPRVEWYVRQHDPEDPENFRKLLLAYLGRIYTGYTVSESLLDLGEYFGIPRGYILAISGDHPLFVDEVLEFEDFSYNKDKPFHHRDLLFSSAIYNIFAGQSISDEDLAGIARKPLTRRFGLVDESTSVATASDEAQDDDYELGDFSDSDDDTVHHFETLQQLLREEEAEEEGAERLGGLAQHEATDTNKEDEDVEDRDAGYEDTYDDAGPYDDDIDYLNAEFQWLYATAQMKEKTEESLVFDERENERQIFMLRHKVKKMRNLCEIRLRHSRETGFIPRLERLSERLQLRPLEKDVLKALVSLPLLSSGSRDNFDRMTIGDLLKLLVDDPRRRVRERRVFRRSAPMARAGLIYIDDDDRIGGDLQDARVTVDNRLIEYLIGEDYDITDYVQGSHLYRPRVHMDSVILPKRTKENVLRTVEAFPKLLQSRSHLRDVNGDQLGRALTMLFVGPSGTGKTMFANALANYLDKRLLLFNFSSMTDVSLLNQPAVFSMLFREARMNDAILFFDEAETLLTERVSELLVQIERHEGIVIFATNASLQIEEAMRRRINLIVTFQEPGPALRRDIWELHLPDHPMRDSSVDLAELSHRYELNGGLIRNAVFSAVAHAVHRDDAPAPAVRTQDLHLGAQEQLRNKLFMANLHKAEVPEHGLDSVVLPPDARQHITRILEYVKSQKVLESEWGFSEHSSDLGGLSILFHGAPGTGKTLTAQALAYELGKTLKRVSRVRILAMLSVGAEDTLEMVLAEAADGESLLLFDDADPIFSPSGQVAAAGPAGSAAELLLRQIEAQNLVAVFATATLDTIEPQTLSRLHHVVFFDRPEKDARERLWRELMPARMPVAEDVKVNSLAERFAFAGGDIRNAILRAAARRASQSNGTEPVRMEDFLTASREIEQSRREAGGKRVGFSGT